MGAGSVRNRDEVIALVVFLFAEVHAFRRAGIEGVGPPFGRGDDVGLVAVTEGHVVEDIRQRQRLFRLHVADLHRREGPDTHVKEEDVVLRRHRLADARNVCSRLGADVAETVDVEPLDLDVPPHAGFRIERVEAVAAGFRAGGTQQADVPHLRQRLHPGDAVAAVNPVVVSFHGDAGDAGVLQRLEDFDGAGKGAGEDLAGVEEVAGDEDKIDLFADGIGNDAGECAEEVLVALVLSGDSTVGFAEVDDRRYG